MLRADETLAYHASRVLILVAFCGTPRGARATARPAIEGRTLLAKLDFFLRYPSYLRKAAVIQQESGALKKKIIFTNDDFGLTTEAEATSVESRMVRYLYGPWDHVYYETIAYLVGKGLIIIEKKRGTEVFRVTALGQEVAAQLASDPAYGDLTRRAITAYYLFNSFTGTGLKDFIYRNFPEVVNREIGATI